MTGFGSLEKVEDTRLATGGTKVASTAEFTTFDAARHTANLIRKLIHLTTIQFASHRPGPE